MELVSLAIVAGSVGASAFVHVKTEQIVNAIDERLRSMARSDERLVVEQQFAKNKSVQADLHLD